MTDKERMQYQIQQIALLTIESILTSTSVKDDAGRLSLISYVVGAATQSVPVLETNV